MVDQIGFLRSLRFVHRKKLFLGLYTLPCFVSWKTELFEDVHQLNFSFLVLVQFFRSILCSEEYAVPSKHVLEDTSQRPDIDCLVIRHIKQNFRCFEPRRAANTLELILNELVHFNGMVEISDFDHSLVVPQNVRRFDISMQNSSLM